MISLYRDESTEDSDLDCVNWTILPTLQAFGATHHRPSTTVCDWNPHRADLFTDEAVRTKALPLVNFGFHQVHDAEAAD